MHAFGRMRMRMRGVSGGVVSAENLKGRGHPTAALYNSGE